MALQLTIDYPETFPDALGRTREQFEQEANGRCLSICLS